MDLPHTGPDLKEGMLPALYYFALSGEDSLFLDPYNRPAALLADNPIRVFSATLPGHEKGRDPKHAMQFWVEELLHDRNIIGEFVNRILGHIDRMIKEKIVDPERIAVAGLSRGGFIATHIAARHPHIHHVLGFAPLISLESLKEFPDDCHHPLILNLSLEKLVNMLVDKHIRFYIGNRDERVKTTACFSFIHHLADVEWHAGVRSPKAELIVSPSIGHKGHGTSEESFLDCVNWLKNVLIH